MQQLEGKCSLARQALLNVYATALHPRCCQLDQHVVAGGIGDPENIALSPRINQTSNVTGGMRRWVFGSPSPNGRGSWSACAPKTTSISSEANPLHPTLNFAKRID
jgi:hypothetical protein